MGHNLKDTFFQLEGAVTRVTEARFLALLGKENSFCSNFVYKPNELNSPYRGRFRAKGITFRNGSFKNTTIKDFEFDHCRFEKCLLLGTIFQNCRFTNCEFVNCNPYRIEFDRCFIDPQSFDKCIPIQGYTNIGVYLYQELLRNSRHQAQPDFADEAQFQFKKWQLFQLTAEFQSRLPGLGNVWTAITIFLRWTFHQTTGSGMRLKRLSLTALISFLILTVVNWLFAGLHSGQNEIKSFSDGLYFSAILVTTVGFGDITPTTTFGRLLVSAEAMIGLVFFALLTSTIYRKFTS